MLSRIFGVVSAVFGIVLTVFGILGFMNAQDMSIMIGMASDSAESISESARWLQHWRLASGVLLVAGLGFAAAGAGLLAKRRWSLPLLASVALLLVLHDLAIWAGGWIRYAFEVPEPEEIAFLLLVAAVSLVVFRRRHPARRS